MHYTKHPEQVTLGQLIDLLMARPSSERVHFEFYGLVPDGIDSYRGFYEDLAVSFDEHGTPMSVGAMIDMLREADGKTFTGYKGGEYTMDMATPLWVGNHGDCRSTAITGIRADVDGTTLIRTVYVP